MSLFLFKLIRCLAQSLKCITLCLKFRKLISELICYFFSSKPFSIKLILKDFNHSLFLFECLSDQAVQAYVSISPSPDHVKNPRFVRPLGPRYLRRHLLIIDESHILILIKGNLTRCYLYVLVAAPSLLLLARQLLRGHCTSKFFLFSLRKQFFHRKRPDRPSCLGPCDSL